jgi:hypothetical protein
MSSVLCYETEGCGAVVLSTPMCEALNEHILERESLMPPSHRSNELLSSSFRMAATEHEVFHQGFEKKHANHHLNETFLGLGYNPSQRLNTCQAPPNTWTDNEPMMIRKFVI